MAKGAGHAWEARLWVKPSDWSGRLVCFSPHLTLPYPNLTFYYYAPLIYIWKRGQSMPLCVKAQLTNWGQLPESASWGGWVTQTSAESGSARWHSSPLVTFTHDPAWCRQISACLIFIAQGGKEILALVTLQIWKPDLWERKRPTI